MSRHDIAMLTQVYAGGLVDEVPCFLRVLGGPLGSWPLNFKSGERAVSKETGSVCK